jgi:hypothetical protein
MMPCSFMKLLLLAALKVLRLASKVPSARAAAMLSALVGIGIARGWPIIVGGTSLAAVPRRLELGICLTGRPAMELGV